MVVLLSSLDFYLSLFLFAESDVSEQKCNLWNGIVKLRTVPDSLSVALYF